MSRWCPNLLIVFTVGMFISCNGTAASGCDMKNLPQGIHDYLQRNFGEWKIVTSEDLLPDHKPVFLKRHPNKCPGFTSGKYKCSDRPLFAVVIISNEKPRRSKLLVFEKVQGSYQATPLGGLPNVVITPVVLTMPPDTYLSWRREKEIKAKYPVIFYVHYEASAQMYYWSEGKWHKLQISD